MPDAPVRASLTASSRTSSGEGASCTLADQLDRWTLPADEAGASEADASDGSPLQRTRATDIEDLWFYRAHGPTHQQHHIYNASVCVIAQGTKEVAVGDRVLRYGEGDFLAVGVDLPVVTHVTEGSPERPYLALAFDLDPRLLFEVAQKAGRFGREASAGTPGDADPAIFVGALHAPARDAFERMVGLLDTPEAIPALYPAITRELYYWLLRGPYGAAIARMGLPDGHARRIASAIAAMKERFPEQIRVAELAEAAHMSPSRFHAYFKDVTATTPIQYYKRLRLLEARRRLVSEGATACDAAYATGYESPSQFSREYKRFFGAPPARDIASRKLETKDD